MPSSRSPGPEGDRVIPGKENDPTLSCFPDGIPKILTSPEPFEIITIPGRVLMFFEKDHGWRQIWTDGRKLPEDPPELRFDGYSVGQWEGDTFIVESNGFNDKLWLDYYGDPHSEQLHLTERYQRLDKDTLSIQVTINDPKAYTKPWVGKPIRYRCGREWKSGSGSARSRTKAGSARRYGFRPSLATETRSSHIPGGICDHERSASRPARD